MKIPTTIHRYVTITFTCLFVSACSQTGPKSSAASSTFAGSLAASPGQAGLLAARKRAAAKRRADQEAFQQDRKKRREERLARLRGEKRPSPEAKVSQRIVDGSKAGRGKVGQVMNVSLGAIKGTAYAHVGGRSRGIHKNGPWKCVPERLKIVLAQVSRKYGRVVINSTHRSHSHNRRVGGRRHSYHLRCHAVDFRVHGKTRGLTRWLANHPYVGGYNRYPSGYYHIDTGPKRTW